MLRVQPRGARIWYLTYDFAGKRRSYRLGEYPRMSLAQARDEARRRRFDLLDGVDPQAARRAAREAAARRIATSALVSAYLDHLKRSGKRTWREDERYLTRTLSRPLGDVPAAEIDRDVIRAAMQTYLDEGKPVAANRCRAHLHALFQWALREGHVDRNPVAGVSKAVKERPRSRWLTTEELVRLWTGLDGTPTTETVQIVIRLLLLTGCRRQEVALARWSEIDLSAREWTIPPDRMKARAEHWVPLSTQAADLLERARELSPGTEYVFASDRADGPLRPASVTRAITRSAPVLEIEHFSPHDLRRTAATHWQRLGYPPHLIGALLAHTRRDLTTTVYAIHHYRDERREALQTWGDFLGGLGDE